VDGRTLHNPEVRPLISPVFFGLERLDLTSESFVHFDAADLSAALRTRLWTLRALVN